VNFMENILRLNDVELLRKSFRLDIPQLDLNAGHIYLVEGPNGAGKSTLLQLLALLMTPTRGVVQFCGERVTQEAQRQRLRRHITLVEQNPYLFDKTVYQNLALGLRLRDVRGDLQRRRITQALGAVGLEGFESRRAKALSGGEARRVALARAVVLSPRLLLLDEPTAGLDRDVLPIFEKCLSNLPAHGTTVVIAGHDIDQSRRLGGTVLKLDRGKLLQSTSDSLPLRKESA